MQTVHIYKGIFSYIDVIGGHQRIHGSKKTEKVEMDQKRGRKRSFEMNLPSSILEPSPVASFSTCSTTVAFIVSNV